MELFIALFTFACLASAHNDPSAPIPGVFELHPESFPGTIVRPGPPKLWLVYFYAPWCGWCVKGMSTLADVAEKYKDAPNVRIAKVDATHPSALDLKVRFQLVGYPSIIAFPSNDASSPIRYHGKRTVSDLTKFIDDHIPAVTASTAHVRAAVKPTTWFEPGVVKELDANDLPVAVEDPSVTVFLMMYAPWCEFCRAIEHDWDQLAASVSSRSDIMIARANVDVVPFSLLESLDLMGSTNKGVPTLVLMVKGAKENRIRYGGDRSLASLMTFMEERVPA
eukprot:TRINITY_DN46318_c0_g1_i1.p1 TRINITY_DN46318_c0_g1~~TRINITY_DN46318_c0_g1_i1.p1  ORF type:complete len:279 (+),score=50.93 TRINITY_DN46318_c0_g1_i1:171-1007(+)